MKWPTTIPDYAFARPLNTVVMIYYESLSPPQKIYILSLCGVLLLKKKIGKTMTLVQSSIYLSQKDKILLSEFC